MKVRAAVLQVTELPAREREGKTQEALKNVSLEGFSVLLRKGVPAPVAGTEIEAVVQVHWRGRGERPLHWLTSWEAAV